MNFRCNGRGPAGCLTTIPKFSSCAHMAETPQRRFFFAATNPPSRLYWADPEFLVIRPDTILERLSRGFHHAKDRTIAARLQSDFNQRLRPYGSMLKLAIDTQRRTVSFSVDLKGESSPIEVEISEYKLHSENGTTYLEIAGDKVTTSREWLNLLIREKAVLQKIPIPANVAWLARLLA